ncbi:alpha/beta hydrolase [Oceanicoccus sagamiensis]|uniref:alpha/beta hydrolase n=1 Tax=Oceanicoccus sagamiensis TaxID=716816 RepID=UPI0030844584
MNLHGGGFTSGSRTNSQIESIPISAVGRTKVISVDYRLAPEHTYPAATEDVVNVYKELLSQYDSNCIGIYGSSAGGILTSQVVAHLLAEKLPLPGAIGMFFAAAYYWNAGDSGYFAEAIVNDPHESPQENPYFEKISKNDLTPFPGYSLETLTQFPPSLLISSTRDEALSSVVHTHSRLRQLGVQADLNVWEGLNHVFLYNSNFSESREAYQIIVDHFHKHLGE